MADLHTQGSPLRREDDVTALTAGDAFDLAVFHERGRQQDNRMVLLVTIRLQFRFANGTSEQPATRGRSLTWTHAQKQDYMRRFKDACYNVWNNRFRIKSTNHAPILDIGVQFDIQTFEGRSISDHYEINVRMADQFHRAATQSGLDWSIHTGSANLYSLDLDPFERAPGFSQRSAPHEFGHMIGLPDEYPDPADPQNRQRSRWWLGDQASIMHSAETIRPRHYTIFADWLTRSWEDFLAAAIHGGRRTFWVDDGTSSRWTLANAGLHTG
jgi:hypothetical protein